MRLLSVQVGRTASCEGRPGPARTAIDKRPVVGRVRARANGLEGDEVANRTHHGGPDRAVLFVSRASYPTFEARVGRALENGGLGENLTVEGLSDADACIGDRVRIGSAELEVSSPRSPCGTLARHLGDPGAVEAASNPHRAGWYARCVVEGDVGAGDAVVLLARPFPEATVERVAAARRGGVATDVVARFAAIPSLGGDWRETLLAVRPRAIAP